MRGDCAPRSHERSRAPSPDDGSIAGGNNSRTRPSWWMTPFLSSVGVERETHARQAPGPCPGAFALVQIVPPFSKQAAI